MASSNGRRSRLYRLIVASMTGSALASLGIGTAYPHDLMRPELDTWFKSLKNKAGEPCCDSGDGEHVEAEWDMTKRGYKVLLKDPRWPTERRQWYDVPYSVVINQPNLSGIAMVWWWPSYDSNPGPAGPMTPMWRCFIPGPGG